MEFIEGLIFELGLFLLVYATPSSVGLAATLFAMLFIVSGVLISRLMNVQTKRANEKLLLQRALDDSSAKLEEVQQRYSGIVDLDEAIADAQKRLSSLEDQLEGAKVQHNEQLELLDQEYKEAQDTYSGKLLILKNLEAQVAVYDERLALGELGIYEPHFDFAVSESVGVCWLICSTS